MFKLLDYFEHVLRFYVFRHHGEGIPDTLHESYAILLSSVLISSASMWWRGEMTVPMILLLQVLSALLIVFWAKARYAIVSAISLLTIANEAFTNYAFWLCGGKPPAIVELVILSWLLAAAFYATKVAGKMDGAE